MTSLFLAHQNLLQEKERGSKSEREREREREREKLLQTSFSLSFKFFLIRNFGAKIYDAMVILLCQILMEKRGSGSQ